MGMTQEVAVERLSYFEILARLGEPVGSWRKGEIEVITEPAEIADAERLLLERARSAGLPPDEAKIGIVAEDGYVLFMRDAVKFPPKTGDQPVIGSYIRFVYRYALGGNLGIFCLIVDECGLLVMNRSFRHAIRSWVIEGAGTIGRSGETPLDSVRRCVRDELGRPIKEIVLLSSNFVPERGLIAGRVPMYLVRVGKPNETVRDLTVQGHLLLTKDEFLSMLRVGVHEFDGRRHVCQDGYTMGAFLLAQMNGLI